MGGWYREPQWSGGEGEDRWGVHVEYDTFDAAGPAEISLELFEADKREQYLAPLNSQQAREIGTALLEHADLIDDINGGRRSA